MKFDWNDISIIPATLSSIDSRNEINPFYNGKLPIFTAPMDTVIDTSNVKTFDDNNINICLPRHVKYSDLKNDNYFYSYGINEIIELFEKDEYLPRRILIDVANGHMQKLFNISKKIKEKFGDKIELMIGNIANPDTFRKYCEIGVDYARCGIGAGNVCTTSANVAIHYPMASLINECSYIAHSFDNPTKIIADGGFKSYSDIIKALALGADSVMVGSLFNKCLESCSPNFIKGMPTEINSNETYIEISLEDATKLLEAGQDVYKYYRGMSTKEVQRSWNKSELKTGEGISKYNKVEDTLSGWCENFTDYLKSAMSYTNSRTLNDFIGEVEFVRITDNAFSRFNK